MNTNNKCSQGAKPPRRQRGWRILANFYAGQTCHHCKRPYDPYRKMISSYRIEGEEGPHFVFGFAHEDCDNKAKDPA